MLEVHCRRRQAKRRRDLFFLHFRFSDDIPGELLRHWARRHGLHLFPSSVFFLFLCLFLVFHFCQTKNIRSSQSSTMSWLISLLSMADPALYILVDSLASKHQNLIFLFHGADCCCSCRFAYKALLRFATELVWAPILPKQS